jgi:enoyl-CoA hydratase/carnithine racemase
MTALAAQPKSDALVLREDAEGIATLTLNRPRAYNALSTRLMTALQAELDAIRDDRGVNVVVVAGAGPGFCAGHDLKELRDNPSRDFASALFRQCAELMLAIVALPQPVIARVHGMAAAAGCQLVATCDLAVAAASAGFAVNGVSIGLFCSTPMVALTRNIGRKPTMKMLLADERVDAETARGYGLVNDVVPDAELAAATTALARKVASRSPLVVKIGKEAFHRQAAMDLAAAYAYTAQVMTENMQARDAAEGIDAFLQKRAPRWCGA